MRKIIFLLMFELPCLLFAQNDRWNLFNRTSALIHHNYPSRNLGVEYFPLKKQLSVTGEIGFIGISGVSEVPFANSRKYYGELRYYISEGSNRLVFGGISYQYRNAQIDDTYIIGFDCMGVNLRDCERYMEYTGRLSSQLHEVQLILGAKTYLGKRFYIDTFMGIGQGSHQLDRSKINNGLLVERGRFWQERSFGSARIQISFTLKVGLVLDRLFSGASSKSAPEDG